MFLTFRQVYNINPMLTNGSARDLYCLHYLNLNLLFQSRLFYYHIIFDYQHKNAIKSTICKRFSA